MMTKKISERDSTEELLNTFRLFDDDGSGKITLQNLRRVAKGTTVMVMPTETMLMVSTSIMTI